MAFWDRWFARDEDAAEGSTPATAIVVDSVPAEYDWVQEHCRGFQPAMQALQEFDGKPYDVLTLHNARGVKRTVYFDISGFFGK